MILSKYEITLKKIALCLKILRDEYNITLNDFYIDTGIHLARIEQGKTNVTVFTLQKICDYFNITMLDFFIRLEQI
ncbi:XRE family transcriptional regulator [Tenacibaculum sp. Bg11-29]|uniref:helix-turn-helix domain-containing protein n=1 Tax=Tenacibaculum sp. Bg11-29 TaxID=2058306 RepID=UPI000C34B313|nr:XRE family transcriptional regulator [Tenacibaculum sp. Bg11-29]